MGSGFLLVCSFITLLCEVLSESAGRMERASTWLLVWALFIVGHCIVRAIERLRDKPAAAGEGE